MTKKILYIDIPGFKPLPHSSVLHLAAYKSHVLSVNDINAALKIIKSSNDVSVLVINNPHLQLFQEYRQDNPLGKTILVTDQVMEDYAKALGHNEHLLIDHVIANLEQVDWLIHCLRTTLQKILRCDIFGLNKYLLPNTPIFEDAVTDSACREKLNQNVMKLAEAHKLGNHVAKLCFGISEELLMNAIYDAPISGGKNVYGHLPRSTRISLQPHEYSTLAYGCDGQTFAIGVKDPFGGLSREKFFEYLKKVLRRDEGTNIIDKKKGGAGLGLFKILYSCHSLICNSSPQRFTEVIALINVHAQIRDFSKMTRSIHFFLEPSP